SSAASYVYNRKDKQYLPSDMSFTVDYLGAEVTQVGLNYSRPAAQILGQYYQFIRLGFEGYKNIQYNSLEIAKYFHSQISKMPEFQPYSEDVPNPIVTWLMKPEVQKKVNWTLYDLQDKLQQHGWMVPAYAMPVNIENMVVMRILCKQGFSRDMCDQLLNDITSAVKELNALEYPTTTRIAMEKNVPIADKTFNHNGHRTTK
ncbi:MAG: glutamate decarboxylase, partial [Muribaculaceae bacterium]|nr:glutamate decarboxylase [Muribaculaceae bacterium]